MFQKNMYFSNIDMVVAAPALAELQLVLVFALIGARHKILVCIPQIWISEIENYQKMSSHALIRSQGAEKKLS